MKKIFASYYNREVEHGGHLYKKDEDREYDESFFELCEAIEEKGIEVILITCQNPYIGNGEFFGYWKPVNHRLEKREGLIKPDLIFDKGHIDFNDGCLNFYNNHDFARLGRNKYTQSVLAGDYMPATQVICSEEDYDKVLEKIKTEKIVIKPLGRNGGTGVTMYDRDKLSENKEFPAIAQEFIETKEGIDGMVNGRHDLRLHIIGGEIALASIRQPKEGGWLSNLHQGGSIQHFTAEETDKELLEFAKPIIEIFNKKGGKHYSVDFMHGNGRWYLCEMNDRPVMPTMHQERANGAVKAFFDKYAEMIARELA